MTSGESAAETPTRAGVIPLLPIWRVDRVFDYLVPPSLSERVQVGHLVRVPFGKRNVRGIVVELASDEGERELAEIIDTVVDVPLAPQPLDRLLDWLARRYGVARGVAFSRAVPPRVRLRVPEVVPLEPVQAEEGLLRGYEGAEALVHAIGARSASTWSLRALPGHDRGVLIGELLDAAARSGRASLVAVPEVRYGSAVLDAIQKRWPQLMRVDSSRPEGERARAWLALAAGHGLGGGGRATVLAPAPDLGLIVLDEEHHHSFKEDRSPRYDARRVAIERARLQDAVCVFVSSTPSLETGLAVRNGAWGQVVAPRHLRRGARPIVEVIEPMPDRAITTELHERVRDTLRAGGRVGLLVPSRGFARALWCASCRRSLRCPQCEAGLFYDRANAAGPGVRCGRCGFRSGAPDTCPSCGAAEWRYLGAGSERLTEQVARAFPRATVARMDPDVLAARETGEAPGEAPDIYVTTWIGTKPALRPRVSLVGVLDADAFIRRPDFRSAENAYQALAEMAEWAGPASEGGRLLVQCSEPGHHAVQAVVRADHDFFVERELESRRELGYPPFAELVKVTSSGPGAEERMNAAIEIARSLRTRVLGPIPAGPGEEPDAREILIKCADATPVAEGLRDLLAKAPGGHLKVDVDPR